MTATDPAEAVTLFVELLRSTVGCITQVPLVAQPIGPDLYNIIFYDGRPVELRTERGYPTHKLSLVNRCAPAPHPTVAGAYTVRSTYYAYEILDLDEAEILADHWHPTGVSSVTLPHLRLSSKVGPIPVAALGRVRDEVWLSDMHILTGRMLLENVVRMLITEFNVYPLTTDWDETLSTNVSAI